MKKLALILSLFASSAFAQEVNKKFNDWTVYTIQQDGKVCYISSPASNKDGTASNRAEPYLLVTHKEIGTPEVSIYAGYPFKKESEVVVKVDKKGDYKFFTKDDRAWAYTSEDDKKLIDAMIRGTRLTARGTSTADTFSLDTFSLRGFTAAYRRMNELCSK